MFFNTNKQIVSVPAVPNGGNATPCPSAPTGKL